LKRMGYAGWLLLAIVCLACGVFPCTPFEEDGTAIAAGSLLLTRSETGAEDLKSLDGDLIYRYDAQPGSYALGCWGIRLFHADPFLLLSLASAAACAASLLLGGFLLGRLSNTSVFAGVGILLLFQELWASAYYPNSTILALPWVLASLLGAAMWPGRALLCLSGLFLAVGAWFRTDVGLLALSLPVLRWWFRGREPKPGVAWTAFMDTIVIAGVCLGVLLSLLLASHVSPLQILAQARGHLVSETLATPDLGVPILGLASAKSHMAFFALGPSVLLGTGVILLACRRDGVSLGYFLSGAMPLYLVYARQATTPKYFLPLLPFLGLPILLACQWILGRPRRGVPPWTVLGLLILPQMFVGLQASFRSKPWVRATEPRLLSFYEVHPSAGPIESVSLLVGAGSIINTDDGPRLSSGIFFLPWTWRTLKRENDRVLNRIVRDLSRDEPTHDRVEEIRRVVTGSTRGWRAIMLCLLREGYGLEEKRDCREEGKAVEVFTSWKREGSRVDLVYRDLGHRQWELFADALEASGAKRTIYIVDRGWEETLFLEKEVGWTKLYGETDLYMLAAYERER